MRKGRRTNWAKLAEALPGAMPTAAPDGPFAPQLARLGDAPPQGAHWIHEIKWDGYRILATVADGVVRLWSRNAIEWTDKIPEIRDAIAALGLRSAALDGELIAGKGTKEDFNLLQAVLSGERQGKLALALFDLLHLDGIDIAAAPLSERKALLQRLLQGADAHLAFSSHIDGDGDAAFQLAGAQHFEGIVSKRADRGYHGGRSDDWRKTKQLRSDEFAVVGYTAPKGGRSGFGALLLARPDPEHGWLYVGRVGSGFSDALLRELTVLIGKAGSATPSVHVPTTDTDLRSARWFAPRFVVEVFYRGIGGQQLLRQASLKAVRPDKDIADLRDADAPAPRAAAARVTPAARKAKADATAKTTKATKVAKAAKSSENKTGGPRRSKRDVAATGTARTPPTLSSPDRVVFPDIGATKREVWDYYSAVMDHLLPEIAGRPLSIIRCPAGAERACFFQKHHTAGLELVSSVRLKEESGTQAEYLVVEDAAGLLELVQFNALEFHPWGAKAQRPDVADRVVFDLDPGPDVPFAEVKRAATDIRKLLAQLELESFLRVSGGKGLHVVVPLAPGCDWDLTKRFAHGFADALAQSQPDRFLATASKRLRNQRIFVDYLRNGRGATAVASYSLRARAGAPVAMPLAWSDLSKLHRADAFKLRDVPAKLKRRRKDPWAGIDALKQNLSRWAETE
ncbi:DNA ligase D [Xanthomonas sacchari]|uniref:DNA ligase D n=1 Tax=Xanthomonas sacchari TaxID=56458 RepID=UPI003D2F7CBC